MLWFVRCGVTRGATSVSKLDRLLLEALSLLGCMESESPPLADEPSYRRTIGEEDARSTRGTDI
jgi:hypothetical protein